MPDITPSIPEKRQLIQSYGGGSFRIAGVHHLGSVLIDPDHTYSWFVEEIFSISLDNLDPIIKDCSRDMLGGAVLLLGTGLEIEEIKPELPIHLRQLGIGLEVMNTGAACRTFNVLLAEERHVMAALIAV